MRNRVGLILVLALLSGGVAAYLGFTVLRDPGAVPVQAAESDLVNVAVAARDMDVGHMLSPEDIRVVSWPRSVLPSGFSAEPSEIVGRGLLVPVKANEPLLSGKLASKEAGGGLPILIAEGRRGLSIKVDDVTGVAGFLLPGTRVDVLVTLDDRSATAGEPITQIVLQNMVVLTAGRMTDRNNRGEPVQVPVVTLDATPEEAEKLILAVNRGRIQLALRNTLDMDTVETSGARIANLLRQQASPVRPVVRRSAPAVPQRSSSIEIYRGTEKRTQPAGGQ